MVERKETGNVEEAEEGQEWGRRGMRLRQEDTKLQCTQTLKLWCDWNATLHNTTVYTLLFACRISLCSLINSPFCIHTEW